MGDEGEDFSQLALPDLFTHKNWKARKSGYESASKEFKVAQPSNPIIREFTDGQLWKGAVSDSNVAAQQEALNAYNAFLDASGTDGARKTRTHTVAGVVEKGLPGRPAAKQAALETLLLLIELDKADPIVEELLPFLSHKQPKLIAATLAALTNIFHAYGCKVVEPKPVIKALPKIYGHADKNVRAEGQNLTVELYRWLREAMKPLFWGELKEVQQKDLEKLFEPVKNEPVPKQERLLRSQQAAKEEAEAAGDPAVEEEEAEEAAEIDLEPEYEAVDVFAKIPKDFSDRLASSKWKDRKEALDETFAAVNVPSMQEGPFDEIFRGLAKSMKDANIAVVTVAANCVECIAKGLRRSFARYRSGILAPMLERFKEKKATVTDAIAAACDAVFMSTGLGEIQTDVMEALTNKNPQIKEHSAKFLARCLKATKDAPTPEQTKEIAEAAKKLLTESAVTLRDVGAEILGVLWKIMGDRNMLSQLDGLDDIRKNKIKEFSDAAEVKAKWKPKAAPPPRPAAAPAGKKPTGTKRPAGGVKKTAPPKPPSSPPLDEPALQPRPTSRPAPAKTGAAGLKPPGIKAPSGLQKPGLKAPAGTASPRRQGVAPDEPAQASPAKPALSAPGRGLAGRPLGKPSTAPSSPPREQTPQPSALSSIERQELSELRSSVELLQQTNSDLRNDKMKLSSQITELQNQNAQLIEDHTRDVLQIKAKETQLVRARSDAENAEDRANSLSKEIDRLKREMSRLGRVRSGSDVPSDDAAAPRPAYGSSRAYTAHVSSRPYSDGEGKENIPDRVGDGKLSGHISASNNAHNPSNLSRPMSNGAASSGRATPASNPESEGVAGQGSVDMNRTTSGEGVESWRRAAEVTQNLKARIEMMKARQNIGRGQ
ncbi:hypothetical protein LTR37_000794 [Vermiconidia calcicola]|uniref:Uncharacterized protein n=1 Tax=Vermiconidia calcicola TaxID=1690605 RepID=A0ACC3NXF8_9PEZI|nr:hypothetical protein LTR37_000794 [Vermiconidia calcicola]